MSNHDTDVIIIEMEKAYSRIVDAFHGEIIEISSVSNNHIKGDESGYGDSASPIMLKREVVLSLCE